jgi:hypothetical protein
MSINNLDGLYVGQLTDAELLEFERLIQEGRAVRAYSGAGGLMGLAKVKILDEPAIASGASNE